jgi:hypothetical protein
MVQKGLLEEGREHEARELCKGNLGAMLVELGGLPGKLADPNWWFHGDESTGNQSIMGWTYSDFGGDTAVGIQVAQTIYNLATGRDKDKEYWKSQIDYSVEGAIGGPLDEGVTMFLAGRGSNQRLVPTEQPDKKLQLMGTSFDMSRRGLNQR